MYKLSKKLFHRNVGDDRTMVKKSKYPKILLLGVLPELSKLYFFFQCNYCRQFGRQFRLKQQPAMGVQLNRIPYYYRNHFIFIDYWNFVINFERYNRLANIYWNDTDSVIGLFSLHSPLSFLKMKYWIDNYIENNRNNLKPIYILCYCNRSSNQHQIDQQYIDNYIKTLPPKLTHLFIINSNTLMDDLKPFFQLFLNRIVNHQDLVQQQRYLYKRLYLKKLFKRLINLRKKNQK